MSSKSSNFVKSTAQNLNSGGSSDSDSAMIALLTLKHVTCSTHRQLSESEIKLLRQSKGEISHFTSHAMAIKELVTN
jgi:hypothetical protein